MDYTIEDVVKKAEMLEKRQNELLAKEAEKREAEVKAEKREASYYKNNLEVRNMEENKILSSAIIEKRSVALANTGVVETVPELIKLIKNRHVASANARYFRGPQTGFKIPMVSANPAAPSKQSEGASNISPDATAALTVKSLSPETFMAILPITWEMAKYSVVSEAEVLGLLAESFGDAIETGMLGSDSSADIKGIFASASVASANKTTAAAAGLATLADVYAFAGKLKSKNGNLKMYMPVEQVTALMTESSSVYDFVKEELAHNGTIRGIEVVESGNITSVTTEGASLVVGIDLASNYGIAWADDLEIRPVNQFNDSKTYYQAIQGMAGDVINPKNAYAIVAHAA